MSKLELLPEVNIENEEAESDLVKSTDKYVLEDGFISEKSQTTIQEATKDSNATSENLDALGFDLITLLENPVKTDREAWYIYSKLKNFKFFTQFIENTDEKDKIDSAMYICKKLQYHKHPAGSVIMKQNQYSNGKVYLVLSGELLVIVAEMDALKQQTLQTEQDQQPERKLTMAETREIDQQIPSIAINKIEESLRSPSSSRSHLKLEAGQYSLPEPSGPNSSRKPSLFKELSLAPQASLKSRGSALPLQTPEMSDALNQIVQLQKQQDLLRKPQTMLIKASTSSFDPSPRMLKRQTNVELNQFKVVNPDPYGKVVNKITKGAYFGERALFKRHKRTATIMANSDVELLTLNQEEFEYVQTEFNKTKKQLLAFISGIFPQLEKLHPISIENLSYTCDIRNCFFHQTIVTEGVTGDEFFIVYDGKLEVIKTLIYDKSDTLNHNMAETKNLYGLKKTTKEQFVIMTMEKGMFFGEEILYNTEPVYEYTVRASTEKTRLLCFKKSKFLFKCPKMVIESLNQTYLSKKQRINKTLHTRLEKRGTRASLELLEEVRPVLAFPKSQASYGPNLHQTPQRTSIVLPQSGSTLNDLGGAMSPPANKSMPKLLLLDFARSPKNGQEEEEISPRGALTRHLLSNNFTSISPQNVANSGSLSPVLKSSSSSPRKGRPLVSPKYNFRISTPDKNNLDRKRKNRIGSVGTVDPSEIREVDNYVNNIKNFKNDFGKTDKEIEKKYKSFKVKQGLIKTNTQPIGLSDYKGNVSLADFVTFKLREKKFIAPVTELQKNLVEGFPDLLESQYSLRKSESSSILQKKTESSPRIQPLNLNEPLIPQLRNSKSVDLRKFKFMLNLDQAERDLVEPLEEKYNIHTRKRSEIGRHSNKAPNIFDSSSLVLKTTRSQAKVENSPRREFAPPVIKMDTQYASGLSWKVINSARNASPRNYSSNNFLKLI